MRFLRWIAGSGLRVTMTIALALAVYHAVSALRVLGGGHLDFVQRLELTALDLKIQARGARPPATWRVAVAAFDEKALQAFGPPPWSRALHARLVDRLTELGAASIAFDVTFEQPARGSGGTNEIEALAAEAGLWLAPARLAAGQGRVEEVARALRSLEKMRSMKSAVAPLVDPLRRALADSRAARASIERFQKELRDAASREDPDERFARSLARSGRVVLGVIALGEPEAGSLRLEHGGEARAVKLLATSTITEVLRVGPDGLRYVIPDSRALIECSLCRIFFGVEAPAERLARATPHFGLINVIPDEDGRYRTVSLVNAIHGAGVLLPALALKAVEVATGSNIEVIGAADDPALQAIRVADRTVETELGTATTLDWYGRFNASELPIFSVADVLSGTVAPALVKDRVIFVAATAVGTHDQRVTPLERAVPGVYVHATLAQNLLDGRHLIRPRWIELLEVLLILAIGVISGLLMTRVGVIGQVLSAAGLAAAWILLDQLVFFERGLLVDTVLPLAQIFLTLLGVALWAFLVERRERWRTRQAFARYLAPRVMEQVLGHPEEYLRLGGRRYEATVLFSDIRGFTTISEALSPEDLGLLLNRYMTPMTNIVFELEGTLDKYIGDAVMAFWGAPIEQPDHALRACRAALQMIRTVETLNVELEAAKLPRIAIGIGLSSGPMTIGNMGSEDHLAYTALGDRVNLGSRLEGQTKDYGVDIILSEATWLLVREQMGCRELGALRVKGKNQPVRIFQLLGERAEVASRLPFVESFHAGLAAFRRRGWDEAVEHFTRARALSGVHGDKCSDRYIAWCMEYKESPPPPDWDGVHVATSK